MNNLFVYLKKPIPPSSFIKINWGNFFLMLFIYFVFALPLGAIDFITLKLTGISRPPLDLSLYKKVLLGIILAPIYEEVLMRLLLVFNRRNIAIFITCCAVFFVYFLIKSNPKFLIYSTLIVAISITCIYHNQCLSFINNNYKIFFYLSAIVFGLLHVFNFTGINGYNLIFTPLLVLPQIFMGLILGYLRVNYGFKYGILFHAIVNTSILFV